MKAILIFIILLMAAPAWAVPHKYRERVYQAQWCNDHHGQMEVTLPDRTRADCLTDRYAVEVDFAYKWHEATGQSMHYAAMVGKQPAIVLILERASDERFLHILQHDFYWIRVFTMTPADIKQRRLP